MRSRSPGVLKSRGPVGLLALALLAGSCAAHQSPPPAPTGLAATATPVDDRDGVGKALDDIFNDPLFARATFGVRVESLRDGRLIYARNSEKLVVPASNMKLLTMAVAAERLGWDFTFPTQLIVDGTIRDGTVSGDLFISGSGDPSIGATASGPSPLFEEWATRLWGLGIRRVDGRIIGDDNAFDDTIIGPGWAWDYLGDGYAAGSSALSYNENVAVIRVQPGATVGAPATVEVTPPGHGLTVTSEVTTVAADGPTSMSQFRRPGGNVLTVRGTIALGRAPVVRTAAVENPTQFFVNALKSALGDEGILVRGDAFDIDDVTGAGGTPAEHPLDHAHIVMDHQSEPLSALAGYFLKESQNFYGEMLLKTLGQKFGRGGSTEAGRRVVAETLTAWGIPEDSYVMYDGSGLSRYNYVSAEAIVLLLKHVWSDERLRGHFLAALPVGGQDGTLGGRMRDTVLAGRVQAKTGTISNVRSLSGFLITESGERLVFSMIANHFTTSSAQVDRVVERALALLAGDAAGR